MTKNIAIFNLVDISTVQGSTESYYVAHRLSEEYNVHIYSTFDPAVKSATYHPLPDSSIIPALFLYNLILLPYFLYHSLKYDFDVIYTYKGFNILPFVISFFTRADWIADFRTKPTGQEREFNRLTGGSSMRKTVYYTLYGYMYKLTLPSAKAVITLSKPLHDHLVEKYNVSQNRIHLLPLGVDTDHFKPIKTEDFEESDLNLVYVGSISPLRGFKTCIEALSASSLQFHVQFHLIGDGPDEYLRDLKADINSQGVEDAVTWHGYVDHENIPELLSKMDAAISPLPNHDSYQVSSPAKIYEYLSMGLPIVCTDIYPHKEILKEEQTGFFYNPQSSEELVEALNRIGNLEVNTWNNIRHQARQIALANDWSVRLKTLTNIIEN